MPEGTAEAGSRGWEPSRSTNEWEGDAFEEGELNGPAQLDLALQSIAQLFNSDGAGRPIAFGEIRTIVQEAWEAQGELFDTAAARLWATDDQGKEFVFSADMLARDGQELSECK
jgi:hypothetical protein